MTEKNCRERSVAILTTTEGESLGGLPISVIARAAGPWQSISMNSPNFMLAKTRKSIRSEDC